MDKFIEAQLKQIAKEAENISLRIAAILGWCAGQESGVDYLLQTGELKQNEFARTDTKKK